jgi:hypothetical protein
MHARLVLMGVAALVACGGPSAADRAGQVAAWLGAARGVVRVWSEGSVSASYADNNLESTEMMLRREAEAASVLDVASRAKVRQAVEVIATLRAAVRDGDRVKAGEAASRLESLATDLARAQAEGDRK